MVNRVCVSHVYPVAPLGAFLERVEKMGNYVTIAPNRENMNKWADALQNGEYRQGKGVLRTPDNSYCCLGVACDISGVGTWKSQNGFVSHEFHYIVVLNPDDPESYEKGVSLITPTLQKWLGINEMGAFRIPGGFKDNRGGTTPTTLTDLNDSGNWSFAQIADIIRCEAIEWVTWDDND